MHQKCHPFQYWMALLRCCCLLDQAKLESWNQIRLRRGILDRVYGWVGRSHNNQHKYELQANAYGHSKGTLTDDPRFVGEMLRR